MSRTSKGTLIIIGGHEDKEGDRAVLCEISRRVKRSRGTCSSSPPPLSIRRRSGASTASSSRIWGYTTSTCWTSAKISALGMAPGLGFLDTVVIDFHFAERGRFGRLLGAVAQNPKNLGLGIDEDTAVVVDPDHTFRVIGSGISISSLSEEQSEGIPSIYDVRLHVLGESDRFDLTHRRPIAADRKGGVEVITETQRLGEEAT